MLRRSRPFCCTESDRALDPRRHKSDWGDVRCGPATLGKVDERSGRQDRKKDRNSPLKREHTKRVTSLTQSRPDWRGLWNRRKGRLPEFTGAGRKKRDYLSTAIKAYPLTLSRRVWGLLVCPRRPAFSKERRRPKQIPNQLRTPCRPQQR